MCPHTVAKDPDVTQTMEADSTATRRVCVNLSAAEEEDSHDVMEGSDNGQYTFHQYVYICSCMLYRATYVRSSIHVATIAVILQAIYVPTFHDWLCNTKSIYMHVHLAMICVFSICITIHSCIYTVCIVKMGMHL